MSDTPHNGTESATLEELRALVQQLIDPREQVTVSQVIAPYLDDTKEEVCKENYDEKTRILKWFTDDFGARLVVTCTPLELQTWIKNHSGWVSKWTKQRVNRTIQRAFNWAVSVRLIRENPFKGARTGGRAAERKSMTDKEFRALLRSSEPIFRRFITFLKFTGCRPGEASALRWSHIDWSRCIAALPDHKTVKKSGKPRVLVLVPTVMKMLA